MFTAASDQYILPGLTGPSYSLERGTRELKGEVMLEITEAGMAKATSRAFLGLLAASIKRYPSGRESMAQREMDIRTLRALTGTDDVDGLAEHSDGDIVKFGDEHAPLILHLMGQIRNQLSVRNTGKH
jgi:hypothetical protein